MKSILANVAMAAAFSSTALAQSAVMEEVYGFHTDDEGVTFQVYSGGCTAAESFKLDVTPSLASDSPTVTLLRVIPDYCRAFFPHGILVKFPFASNGLAGVRFKLANPVSGPWIDLGAK
jgi:hypothetical protein